MATLLSPAAKKAARKKLLTKLGIEAQSLLTTCLATGGGSLKRNEYSMFWEQVDTPAEATWLLGEIATLLNKQIELGAKGAQIGEQNAALGGPNSGVAVETLLTTFNFIVLTLELLTADKKIREILTTWAKIETMQNASKNLQSQHPLFPQAKELYRMLNLRVENHELIGPLILNCISMYGSIREFERMMDILNYSTVDDYVDLKGGESSFYYEYLKRLATNGFATPQTTTIGKTPQPATGAVGTGTPQAMLAQILQNTVSKIITLPQHMKMNPKVAETTFCALFHLMRNLMSLHAIADTNFLRMTLSTLQPFYLWPQPYGIQTRELLIQLQEETLIPGSFLRARLDQEVHTAPYVEMDGNPSTPVGEVTSALIYLYAQDDRQVQSYLNVLDLKPFKLQQVKKHPPYVKEQDAIPILLTPSSQAMTILNLLANEPQFSSGLDADAAAMKQLGGESVLILYRKVQAMMRDIAERPGEAKELRARTMQDIRQTLRGMKADSSPIRLPTSATVFAPPFSMPLPPVSHLGLGTRSTAVGTYQFDARDQWRIIGYKVAPFVHVPLQEDLEKVFTMYRDPSRIQPIQIRLMIAGSDELLHQVVCAWCALKQAKPELFDGLSPKFYLLPFSKNHMAAFLARHDAWYNRHIYVPSRSSTFMAPWIRVDQNDLDGSGASSSSSSSSSPAGLEEEGAELPPPGQFFRRSFESYAREAQVTCEPHIYQLEGFLTPDSEGLKPALNSKNPGIPGPDQLVPFLQRAEIGVMAAAAEFRRTRPAIPASVRLEDIASGVSPHSKGFEYTPVDLVVKFTKMDLQGNITEVVTEDATVYQSLLVSNVPRKSDFLFPPNPTSPNLEMGARLHKNYNAQKAAQLGRKNVLAQDAKQHVVEVEIWAANPQQTFSIVIDNQPFGPYYRVKLLPCFETFVEKEAAAATSTGKRMKFPIQTFFPMDM
jgi:hypothetical protein